MRFRDAIGLDEDQQHALTRMMQIALVGLLFVGIDRRNPGIVVNTLVGIGVTLLPSFLERDYGIPMDAGLTLWITSAAFLHALGTVGIPGVAGTFYKNSYTWWWDHMTHALSSSLVAAAGYATVRAIDEHREDIYVPPRLTFVFVLAFVMAFGVVWELLEFGLGVVADMSGGGEAVLIQFGVDDTMRDLVFNAVGGIVVALWGQAYLTDVVGALQARLDDRESGDRTP
ncbi:hypothetical protein [Haloarchaeobius sp. HRN-SO-5]|uniref:hypothetical protein n=1 Tax=Haloarchaeobius sp. HRN-SO-5 TaxID=3446118 RepID=UPI003EBF4B04